MPKRLLLALGAVAVVLVAGLATAWFVALRPSTPVGSIDTELTDVTVVTSKRPVGHAPKKPRTARVHHELPCWDAFGGGPLRALARDELRLGTPRRAAWARGLGDLMEYPPTYCDGRLYVNLEEGKTLAIDAATGKVLWSRKAPGATASSPAIAGDRLIVTSHGGTITAVRRNDGSFLWQLRVGVPVESSPVVVDGVVFVGASDGRLFAVDVKTGKPRWVYDIRGRISSSPSVVRGRVCITTYSGAVGCFRKTTGRRLWLRYFKRDFFRYASFYASPSSDGERVFTVSLDGRVLALDVITGDTVWQARTGGFTYGTPALADGRVFVADLDGDLRAFRATDGRELWSRRAGGRVLGPTLVVGNLLFYSTLEGQTYALRASTGDVRWRFKAGKYAPGIATNGHYYFSLNGLLVAFKGS